MANPFTRRHLTDQLENGIASLQKFAAFMDESININMKYKKTIVKTIVFYL